MTMDAYNQSLLDQMDEALADAEPKESLEDAVRRLAALKPLEYERVRQGEAEALGVRVSALDSEIKAQREAGGDDDGVSAVEELEPWLDPVDGAVLDQIRGDFGRYVVAPAESLDTLSLWALGTFCYDAFSIFPKAFLSSPERRCGKTVALEVLEANTCRALMASSITASAIFRAVQEWRPTLIVDEADRLSKDNEELVGIINAGHRKRSAIVIRNVKVADEYIPRKFSVWSPMAIGAIGRMADSIMDRSIVVHMRRKAPGERAEKIPLDLFESNHDLRRRCLRWGADNMHLLRSTNVAMPHHGNDRALDNWLPMFALAAVIGGDWPGRAEKAFAKLTVEEQEDALGPMLLADIRQIFKDKRADKIPSKDLVATLVEMEDRPWGEWRRGRPMTQNSLSRLLDPYRINPGTIRIGSMTPKGYRLSQFRDAFDRYLTATPSPDTTNQAATPPQLSSGAASGEIQAATNPADVSARNSRKPSNGAGCGGVAAENGVSGGETPNQRLVLAWLNSIGATAEEIEDTMERCSRDPAAREYFVQQARAST